MRIVDLGPRIQPEEVEWVGRDKLSPDRDYLNQNRVRKSQTTQTFIEVCQKDKGLL